MQRSIAPASSPLLNYSGESPSLDEFPLFRRVITGIESCSCCNLDPQEVVEHIDLLGRPISAFLQLSQRPIPADELVSCRLTT